MKIGQQGSDHSNIGSGRRMDCPGFIRTLWTFGRGALLDNFATTNMTLRRGKVLLGAVRTYLSDLSCLLSSWDLRGCKDISQDGIGMFFK